MADQGREALELAIGTAMAQAAIVEFLIKQGVISRDPLLEHLAVKQISWRSGGSVAPNALFAADLLVSLIAGQTSPPAPASTH